MHAPKPPLCQIAIGAFYEQHLIHEQTTCLPPRRGEVSPQVTERGQIRQRTPLSLADARQLSPCTRGADGPYGLVRGTKWYLL